MHTTFLHDVIFWTISRNFYQYLARTLADFITVQIVRQIYLESFLKNLLQAPPLYQSLNPQYLLLRLTIRAPELRSGNSINTCFLLCSHPKQSEECWKKLSILPRSAWKRSFWKCTERWLHSSWRVLGLTVQDWTKIIFNFYLLLCYMP